MSYPDGVTGAMASVRAVRKLGKGNIGGMTTTANCRVYPGMIGREMIIQEAEQVAAFIAN